MKCNKKIFMYITKTILQETCNMSRNIPMKFRNWIDENKIDWEILSLNPNAIYLLERNPDKIDWKYLSGNPNAICLLENHMKYYNYFEWLYNLIDGLKYFNNNIRNGVDNSGSGTAMQSLRSVPSLTISISWAILSLNPNAIHLLEKNPDKIDWKWLSLNPNAIHLLERNPDKIYWQQLSGNHNAIHLLEQYPYKIDWQQLSRNSNAIHLLEKNPDKIDWHALSSNLNIFTYDYNTMKNKKFTEELIHKMWHPSRIAAWLDAGLDLDDL